MKPDLRSAWKNNVLVGDGAMGTFLYQKGFPVGISYEELNLTSPEVIEDVHRSYIGAGAVLLESNTYSANYDKLSKFGLEAKVGDINRAGVQIARRAAGESGYVVGAVGSIRAGKRANLSGTELKRFYTEQFSALLEEQPDGILLETFYDVEELHLALRSVRKLSDLPVICQLAVDETARTLDGLTLPEAFHILEQDGADVIGFNCRTGPNGIKRALKSLQGNLKLPASIYPNAGIADYVDGQYRYGASPEYFGQMAPVFADMGARVIGGCCGTTPTHIAAISTALRGYTPPPLPAP
ncbi:homocysteine methyltransferase, partial [Paenibacillus riograndensis]